MDLILPSEDDARTLREIVQRVRNLKGGPGILVQNSSHGITISLARQQMIVQRQTFAQGFFTVIVKANGTSGTPANPTYDLYDLRDTGLTTKLNTSGPLTPRCSRARSITSLTVTAPTDGEMATACYDGVGNLVLWDLPETETPSTDCTA